VPRPVLEKVLKAATQALGTPAARRVLEQQAFNIVPTTSLDEARSWFTGELRDWRKVIRETKIEEAN
jgi:hypothetical protein